MQSINYWDNVPENFTGVVKFSTYDIWFLNGEYHRDDGPAVIYEEGLKSWWLYNIRYDSQEEWFDSLTSEQKEKAIWNMDNW